MPVWTRFQGPDPKEAFTRPLGVLESAFYWDSVCAGVSDTLVQLTLEIPAYDSTSLGPFSSKNVTRAWVATKNLHPLLGATIQERPDASGLDFVVDEAQLGTVNSDEIVFTTVQSDEEACSVVNDIMNGPRRLSKDLLVQLWIISFPHRTSSSSPVVDYQCFLHMAHSISDGVAQSTIIRTFFDILAHPTSPEMYISNDSLESRLMPHLAIDDLSPSRKYSLARRRWRLAIARVIHNKMTAAWRGGHTLPRIATGSAANTFPVSRTLRLMFSKELSKRAIKCCRQVGITFGHALPVLAQIAHARILHRLHGKGALSQAEWTRRITQPMHFSGPLNLRPYLDPEWLAAGGTYRVCIALSFYGSTLPAMPVARTSIGPAEGPEKPPFEALLSRSRFFHRCRIVKKQSSKFLGHPLQTEFAQILRTAKFERRRLCALDWRAQLDGTRPNLSSETAFQDNPDEEYILSNGCSTGGDMTNIVPADYPLGSAPRSARVHLTSIRHYLRCRTAELYISAVSYQHELQLMVFCDTRSYNETLVREWLSDVGQAMEWYLGYLGGNDASKL